MLPMLRVSVKRSPLQTFLATAVMSTGRVQIVHIFCILVDLFANFCFMDVSFFLSLCRFLLPIVCAPVSDLSPWGTFPQHTAIFVACRRSVRKALCNWNALCNQGDEELP